MQTVARRSLFLAFLEIGLYGFGGVAAWSRWIIVEKRGWLDEAEYAELLSVFVRTAQEALAPIAIGLILASGIVMAQVTDKSFLTLAVTLGMTLLVFSPVSIRFGDCNGRAILGLCTGGR
jgi:chromate transport protein ChrA